MQNSLTQRFFKACATGEVDVLRESIATDVALVHAADPGASHAGWTGLHRAAKNGRLEAVRLLLEHGADPNAREAGDNTTPLHWAAAHRHIDVVRALLDAGTDVHGFGDVHELDVIGWATYFRDPEREPGHNPEVAALLVERGARHHIFSAICIGDLDVIRAVVKENPDALHRRMSRFEQGLGALQFAIRRNRFDIVDLLIELGADTDDAMLLGNSETRSRLIAAGAKQPPRVDPSTVRARMNDLASSITRCVPMIYVPDVAAALDWYISIGFTEAARFEDDGVVNFGIVSLGETEIMLNMHGERGEHDVSLWFNTNKIDEIYSVLKYNVEMHEPINDTFYHARQFAIRDLNGYILYFIQPGGARES